MSAYTQEPSTTLFASAAKADAKEGTSNEFVEDNGESNVVSEIYSDVSSDVTQESPCPSGDMPESDESKASMAENPFDSEASKILFEALDELQSCNAKQYIKTPQLVIVGAQSAGKSSLLRSLTGIPFPVGKGCCTRFATRIVSRRTDAGSPNEVHISLTPPEFVVSKFGYTANDFCKEFKRSRRTITESDFLEIIEEVETKYLDIRRGKGATNKKFATEVLKIEISGPNRSYFSILDIPGVINNTLRVEHSEMAGIKDLVTQYMEQDGNIVICVADASVDLETQAIFELARKHQVDDKRLIGVYTKCDRSDNEDAIVDVVNRRESNGARRFTKHGWFVVRNKTDKDNDDPAFDLEKTEAELFNTSPWNQISPMRKGSAMLKKYLGRLLSGKTRDAFPEISKLLAEQLKQAQSSMQKLGHPRNSQEQRNAYLTDIAQQYRYRIWESLEKPFSLDVQCRVRPRVKTENERFNNKMISEGHTYRFENHNLEMEDYLDMIQRIIYPNQPPLLATKTPAIDAKSKREAVADGKSNNVLSEDQLRTKIHEEVVTCGSTGLPGMVHPDVVHRLYVCQTKNWHSYAKYHVKNTSEYILESAKNILSMVCPAEGTTAGLHAELLLVLRKFYEDSLHKSLEALEKYCSGDSSKLLQTTDPGFKQKLERLRTVRMAAGIRVATDMANHPEQALPIGSFSELLFSKCHYSTIENTINDVHDTLKVYYEFSLQSFIRHITNTIMEDFVIDPNGVLFGLSSAYIQALASSEIDRLGGESREVVEEREMLRVRIETLQSAEQTARLAMLRASSLA